MNSICTWFHSYLLAGVHFPIWHIQGPTHLVVFSVRFVTFCVGVFYLIVLIPICFDFHFCVIFIILVFISSLFCCFSFFLSLLKRKRKRKSKDVGYDDEKDLGEVTVVEITVKLYSIKINKTK